jgi:hypothetical protein
MLIAAFQRTLRIQDKPVFLIEHHEIVLEPADADLRPLQVTQQTYLATAGAGPVPYTFTTLALLIVRVVGEVEANHIDTGMNELVHDLRVIRGRSQSCNDLGASWHRVRQLYMLGDEEVAGG